MYFTINQGTDDIQELIAQTRKQMLLYTPYWVDPAPDNLFGSDVPIDLPVYAKYNLEGDIKPQFERIIQRTRHNVLDQPFIQQLRDDTGGDEYINLISEEKILYGIVTPALMPHSVLKSVPMTSPFLVRPLYREAYLLQPYRPVMKRLHKYLTYGGDQNDEQLFNKLFDELVNIFDLVKKDVELLYPDDGRSKSEIIHKYIDIL